MKKTLLFFAGALLVTSNINAQITLNQAGYTSSPIGTDSLKMTTVASTFPSFAPTINATWDLSNVIDSAVNLFIYKVAATTPATFADSNNYTLGTYVYQGDVQKNIAASGLLEYGINIKNATFPLTSVGAGDTLFIPTQNGTYITTPRSIISFPATMSTSWTSTYESDFNYQLTYVPGYAHAPGVVKSFYTEKDTVIGWGKMKIKTAAGTPSGYMNVLQVRTQITRTDNFYLNGSMTDPLLGPLLGILGVTQGAVTKTYAQNFYRMNEVTPLAYVQFSDSANVTPVRATTHTQRLALPSAVGIVLNEANIKIYPNPVSGRMLSIELPAATGEWKYELVNVAGQTVAANMLQVSGNHAQIQFAAALAPGTYYVRIINDGNQVAVKPLEIK